jgi:hypothetical protein
VPADLTVQLANKARGVGQCAHCLKRLLHAEVSSNVHSVASVAVMLRSFCPSPSNPDPSNGMCTRWNPTWALAMAKAQPSRCLVMTRWTSSRSYRRPVFGARAPLSIKHRCETSPLIHRAPLPYNNKPLIAGLVLLLLLMNTHRDMALVKSQIQGVRGTVSWGCRCSLFLFLQ